MSIKSTYSPQLEIKLRLGHLGPFANSTVLTDHRSRSFIDFFGLVIIHFECPHISLIYHPLVVNFYDLALRVLLRVSCSGNTKR